MASLTLLAGPAGAGKSQAAAAMLEAGEVSVVADTTALWAALSGASRNASGKYPERADNDPALVVARVVQTAAARQALESGFDVAVTTSRKGQAERWQTLAVNRGASFRQRILDPGREVVRSRLAETDGNLSEACERAVARWYDDGFDY